MRLSDFGWVRSMNSPLRLCLCLVLVGIMISSAAGCTPQQEVLLPGIGYFKASPPILKDGDAAKYQIKVSNAEEIWLYEGGVNIGKWNGPPSGTHTHKITFQGMPANAIPTDDGKFEARLVVSNKKGKLDKELQLSVAAPATPAPGQPGASDNETGDNESYWLDQSFLSDASPEPRRETSNVSPPMEHLPQFADCDCASGCKYCLKPDEAASGGFAKCSDEPCYTSPSQDEKFYCYREQQGWCCANENVNQSTKSECTRIGGYWSTNQYEAIEACQPKGYCCYNNQVYYPVTQAQCAQKGGSYWSTSEAQVMQVCQPPCWCCVKGTPTTGYALLCTPGQVVETTQSQCSVMGGSCHSTQGAATAACACQPSGDTTTPWSPR